MHTKYKGRRTHMHTLIDTKYKGRRTHMHTLVQNTKVTHANIDTHKIQR